ncbi:hypothetical protein HMPREF2533_02273 [Bacteroides fragilis]|nr:hypothetical protein HMPREF2530_02273 [Bacteroides fragilis]KXU45835.1 hypothetical protein HMPREF2533_02273 [Bacteroides fragilis]
MDKGRFRCKPERSLFFSAIPKSGSLLPEARLSAIFIPVLRSPSYLLFFLFRLPPQLSYKAWFVYDICNILFR